MVAVVAANIPDLIDVDRAIEMLIAHHGQPGYRSLMDKCLEVVCHDFEDFLAKPQFLNVSKNVLKAILGRDDLCAEEALVYESAKKWFTHEPATRKESLEVMSALMD
eukprot:TRINITY_DN2048_c0_g1_i2.p1 TRINITY_DN2048_c0_g1~~TRINITY_DN2048_c0_g1_i2.p1  ORF type:complete len:119 (+),score=23.05 TRINITY_DN2048_c0_g1_i2:37-357(+)